MKRFLLIIVLVFASCSETQYGEKNDVGYSYHFNSVTGDNTNLGTKEKPFRSLDFLKNINLSNGDKILLSNGSTFLNTIELIHENGIEISNYEIDGNSKQPIINSKGKIDASLIHELTILFPSPTYTIFKSLKLSFFCSQIVNISVRIWHGWL